jgi:hypothetical protein
LKLAYYLHLNYGPNSGVFNKVIGQIRYWLGAGHSVAIFVATSRKDLLPQIQKELPEALVYGKTYLPGVRAKALFSRYAALGSLCRDIVSYGSDIVYMRQEMWNYPLEYLANRCNLILEINTNDLAEYKSFSRSRYYFHLVTRHRLLTKCVGVVFPTEELKTISTFKKTFGKSVVISNGTNLPEIMPTFSVRPQPKLIFLGTQSISWHGVDKIKILANRFRSWEFVTYGVKPEDFNGLPPSNIKVLPESPRSVYQRDIFDATVGIGTLALHRKNMNEACPLKTREYLASGLPVVIGYNDTDFRGEFDFVCQLENTEENITNNLSRIEGFVKSWHGRRIPLAQVGHLNVDQKEKSRLSFFEDALRARGFATDPDSI